MFGPPGVGKGTQAKLLSEEAGVVHISTGDMLRAMVAAGTDQGTQSESYMKGGQLVPDDVMIKIVRDVLASPKAAKGFVLDGFPRTLPQARALFRIFEELNIKDYRVIEFASDDEEIIHRISSRLICTKDGNIYNSETDKLSKGMPCPKCGTPLTQRDDDRAETVRERLKVYHSTTAPVIHYYKATGVVLSVDGLGSVDAVNREIKALLKGSGSQ
jgi:adenylate kinase